MKKIFTNKKAIGAEVDWIIAGGIFLIYLLMTLVYFKPGLNPVFNPDNLLDIVESRFEDYKDGAYWTITTQPMFVEAIQFETTDSTGSTVTKNLVGSDNPPYNSGGNANCVEFKGEYDGTAFVANNENFPLKLEGDKTKVFFVGDTIQDLTNEKQSDEDKREKIDCGKIIGDIGKYDGLMSGTPGVVDTDGTTSIVCTQYLNKDCETFSTDCDSAAFDYSSCMGEKTECKQCKVWNDAKSELKNKKEAIPNCGTAADDKENVVVNNPTTIQLKEGYLNFNIGAAPNNNLMFIPYFTGLNKKTKYILTYSDSQINFENSPPTCATPDPACIIKGTPTITSACHAKYELGVAETVKGISLAKFRTLANTCDEDKVNGYNCRKNIWGYPALKDFKIRIYTKEKIIAEFPKEPIIPTNINVYSRQFNSFILNEDGLREAVTVNILVW